MTERPDPPATAADEPPPWEWLAAALGLLALLGVVAFLGWEAVRLGASPPDPNVTVKQVLPQGGRFLVVIRVENRGSTAASALKVAGELFAGGAQAERRETEFQYVPGASVREGGLFFSHDPRNHRLELSVESYQKP